MYFAIRYSRYLKGLRVEIWHKMKVLFAFYAMEYNTFPYELAKSVEVEGVQVQIGIEAFWSCDLQLDIIHIHWPESLFKWQEPDREELIKIESTLRNWRELGSKIVTTRHNITKHNNDTRNFDTLYSLVYKYSQAVIHLGKYSIKEFAVRYKEKEFVNQQRHVTIPHGIYTDNPDDISRDDAREKLKINFSDFALLAFGQIRAKEEKDLLKGAFEKIHISNKKLIVPRWSLPKKRWKRALEKVYYKLHPDYRFDWHMVPSEDIQLFMNAADVVIIPRIKNLNSGVLILAFTFGKVVVGTDFGVIGEILSETGNPTFAPDDISSVVCAIEDAKELAENGKGEENRIYAHKKWNWGKITQEHLALYKTLISDTQNK